MWHFFRGYVIIRIEGESIAAFLRSISEAGIRVLDVRRTEDGIVSAAIPSKRFSELHRLRNGRRIRIRICRRIGYPFLLRRLLKRPALLWGGLAAMIALIVLSGRIWFIRIEGAERIDPAEIMALLSEHGLFIGSRPFGPVLITAANDLSARIQDAAWIGLDREGVTPKVTVKEARTATAKKTDSVPYDICSDKDAVVTRLTVMRGQATVKPGDHVKTGDVLISGTVRYKDASYATSADGVVFAAVRYEASSEVPSTVREARETGNTEIVRMVRVGHWEIFRSDPAFDFYRLSAFETAGDDYLLPVISEYATAYELVLADRTLESNEALELAFQQARELALDRVPKDVSILNQYATLRTENGVCMAYVVITTEEIIGRTEEIPNDG